MPEELDPDQLQREEVDPDDVELDDAGAVVDVEPLDPVVADVEPVDAAVVVAVVPEELVVVDVVVLAADAVVPEPVLVVDPVAAPAAAAPPRTNPAARAPMPIMFRTFRCIGLPFGDCRPVGLPRRLGGYRQVEGVPCDLPRTPLCARSQFAKAPVRILSGRQRVRWAGECTRLSTGRNGGFPGQGGRSSRVGNLLQRDSTLLYWVPRIEMVRDQKRGRSNG